MAADVEMTQILSPDAGGIAIAVDLLRQGQLVAFPTETVYGLGGDAMSDLAVARIYEAKGRPRINPLIAHVANMAMARRLAEFDARAEALAARFWPGPLTLVLPLRDAGLSPFVTAELPTVAIRLPAHPVARALIAAFGGPLAAPSANPSGRVSPTRAEHVMEGLSGRIAAVIDGGNCPVGVESTILGVFDRLELLRAGGVTAEEIEVLTGPLVVSGGRGTGIGGPFGGSDGVPGGVPGAGSFGRRGGGSAGGSEESLAPRPNAPGQLASHYAPNAPVRLEASDIRPGEVRLGFGAGVADLNLSPAADLVEAAANLFHMLRQADRLAMGRPIAVAPIPETGLGRAINDRLRRAAAPRPL